MLNNSFKTFSFGKIAHCPKRVAASNRFCGLRLKALLSRMVLSLALLGRFELAVGMETGLHELNNSSRFKVEIDLDKPNKFIFADV